MKNNNFNNKDFNDNDLKNMDEKKNVMNNVINDRGLKNKRVNLFNILVGLIIILPFIITILWSISTRWPWPNLLPKSISTYGYDALLKSSDYKLIPSSILLSLNVTLISLIISIPTAKALSYDFKFKRIFEVMVFLPIIIPITAISMGIHVSFIKMNLAYTYLGVVILQVFPTLPYAIRILQSVFEIISDNYKYASLMLGASSRKTFFTITLPLILPGVISAAFMAFIVSFSQYFLTLLIGGGKVETFTTRMLPYLLTANRTVSSVYIILFTSIAILVLGILNGLIKRYYKNKIKEFNYV